MSNKVDSNDVKLTLIDKVDFDSVTYSSLEVLRYNSL